MLIANFNIRINYLHILAMSCDSSEELIALCQIATLYMQSLTIIRLYHLSDCSTRIR